MRYTEGGEEGLRACFARSYYGGDARVWLGVALVLSPAGLALGLSLGPGRASWLVVSLIAVYLVAGVIGSVRVVPLTLLLAIHTGALYSSASTKLILPLFYIEEGPYGRTLALDLIQLLIAYDIASTILACRKGKVKFKAPKDSEEIGPEEGQGAAVV